MSNDFVFFVGAGRLAPQHAANPRHQHARAEGLGNIVVGPQIQPTHNVRFFALGGEHDDRDVLGAWIGFEQPAQFQTVDARQQQVEHDQIGLRGLCFLQSAFARCDARDSIAFLGEVVIHQFEQIFLVVNDEDPFAIHRRALQHGGCVSRHQG